MAADEQLIHRGVHLLQFQLLKRNPIEEKALRAEQTYRGRGNTLF